MDKHAVVIGGGIGGLSGAIRLAAGGVAVDLYEQNETPGGKMGRLQLNGYTFDTGPTLITMPFVFDDLFALAGHIFRDLVDLVPLDPMCRYWYADGNILDASCNADRMSRRLETWAPGDVSGFNSFMKYAERIYEETADVFIFSPIHEWRHMLKWRHFRKLLTLGRIDAFRTVHQSVTHFFRDPRLVQLFDRYPTYNGSDPYQAPATLNVIPWVELGLGGYHIKGGLYRLVEALEHTAVSLGVRIHTGERVDAILHDGRRVTGVQTGSSRAPVRTVLCNRDVVTTFGTLIEGFPKIRTKLNRLEPSLSGIVFFWGVRGRHERLAQHNILFSGDYAAEFRQIFKNLEIPDDPTVYVAITSKQDASHAPEGCENWFVLVNVPYIRGDEDWDALTRSVRASVLEKLKQHGFDIASGIEAERILNPRDMLSLYGSNRGSIYGISSNTRSSAFRRPANRSRVLKGLYFAGGSVHPGGGVPMCCLSGRMAAELILEQRAEC